jgi:hypothetical protein
MNSSLVAAAHDDWDATYVGRRVVALLGDLTFVPDVHPVAIEDPVHLCIEDIRGRIGAGMNPEVVFFDEVLESSVLFGQV